MTLRKFSRKMHGTASLQVAIKLRRRTSVRKIFQFRGFSRDDVRWDDMQMKLAEDKVLLNSSAPMSDDASSK